MPINKLLVTLSCCFCISFIPAHATNIVENDPIKAPVDAEMGLKKAFQDKFYIGTALNTRQIMGGDPETMEVVKQHFNSIVAENVMKSARIQPREGEFNFSIADKFVEFGEQHEMHIHGHTLIWHSQAPKWFFQDEQGNQVSREVLVQRMQDHISTVVGRYKGRVHSWDVVNEAIEDDGSYRKSKFHEIIGEDFIKLAFQFAHEADPDAKLFYNDYSMANPEKREGVVKMVKKLKEAGAPIHGIGMQGHIGLNHPNINEFEKSLKAYGALGEVVVSELDLSVLPSPWGDAGAEISNNFEYEDEMNPFPKGLPDAVQEQLSNRYVEFFKLFLKYQDNISRVTLWGVNDGHSWKNNWPVQGRTDYPLLFDRENNPKPVVKELTELGRKSLSSSSQSNFSSNLIGLGVVVSDLDRSLDFYINGIGMVESHSFTINEDFARRSGLSNGIPTTVTVLKLEDSPEANEWKLMSFEKKSTTSKSEYIQDDTGVQYITINVKALKPVIERLKQKKVPFLGSTPTPLNQDLHFLLVQDPYGIFIELIGPMQ